jgi:ATP-binding cassette subfamily C protein
MRKLAKKTMNIDSVRKILDLLGTDERRNLYILMAAVIVMAGLEVVSVASIMPFLSVAANPASIQENAFLKWGYEFFGYTRVDSYLISLGLASLAALVLSNAFIILVLWLQDRYVWNRNHSISKRLLQQYLSQPYEYFLTRNSADLSKNILEESREVTVQLLQPALQGIAKAVVAIAIVAFLLVIEPFVALGVAVVLGGAYILIYFYVRDTLEEIGSKRVDANQVRYQTVSEAFGGIKEVKIRGKETVFLDQFDEPSKLYARYQTINKVVNKSPRYILEALAFGGVIAIAVYLIAVQEELRRVVPMLGLYAFAGYRLMPALQRSFKGFAMLRFNQEALRTLHRDITGESEELMESTPRSRLRGAASSASAEDADSTERKESEASAGQVLRMDDVLQLNDVSFIYPEANEPAVSEVSLSIEARTTVGFVGQTGSGKTTIVDVILGLLRPQHGDVTVDGTPLYAGNTRAWQREIGYVPQSIYLADDTVASNIAFGVPDDEVDLDEVAEVARMAQIHDFIEKEMPDGYQTSVGERGVKLSGGQRQRIGIARALYHDPSLLVFDEATSALDQATESRVMEAIHGLSGQHTIILIAHRLSTVSRAQCVFMLRQGRLVGEGTYDELLKENEAFQEMAHA